MKLPIVKIGNSKGIRIPKALMDKYSFEEEVEIELTEDGMIVHPVRKVREGWGQAFAKMREQKDDVLLIDDFFEDEQWED